MKKIFFLTAIFSLTLISGLNAQDETEPSAKAPKKTTANATEPDSVEVVISPKKGQDSTIVRVGGMKIIVLEDKNSDGSNKDKFVIDTIKEDSLCNDDDDDFDPVHHWAGFRLGIDGLLYDNGLSMPASFDYLELDYARSIGWSLNFYEKDFRLYKNYIELVTGLGFNMTNYTFQSDYATIQTTDPITATVDSSRVLERNRLKAYYLTAPLMLGFSTSQDQSKAFRLAAGGQVSWRVGSRLKQKYTMDGDVIKPKVRSDYNLNPFLFSAIASVGYGPVNIYATYGLNTVFEDGKGPDLYPFNAGMQLMF